MKTIVLIMTLVALAEAATYNAASCSTTDVQAAINLASNGDTVAIPSGSCTWTSGVTISGKYITLQGQGAGRVIGRSTSSVSVGTGTKVFTTQAGLTISNGQTLRIERTGTPHVLGSPTDVRTYMIGTVTSYSGTTLTMNISSTGGSGTQSVWIISTTPSTSITRTITSGDSLTVNESTSGSNEIVGIKFLWGTGDGGKHIMVNGATNGQPTLIHDNYFECNRTSGNTVIWSTSPRGLLYSNSFAAFGFSESVQPLVIYASSFNSWTTTSTMGQSDMTKMWFIEDNDFHAFLNSMDLDDNARGVVRYNLFNNSGIGTHGADTSNYGVRHYEIYNNTFIYNGFSDGTSMNLNYYLFLRGGTGVFYNNTLNDITSGDYGNKPEINMIVMNLQRNGGPNPCWGAGTSGGARYHAPRQVGIGRVTGSGTDGLGRSSDSITYVGDSEPFYIWGNSILVGASVSDYGGSECSSPDTSSNYLVAGRDYFNNGTAKPGWTPYTYPHPLAGGSATDSSKVSGQVRFSGMAK